MATHQGPIVCKALLSVELISLRKESMLAREQVAEDLNWSTSKLIRMEGGRGSITEADLDTLLARYRVSVESDRMRLRELNRETGERGWWEAYKDNIAPVYREYVGYEAGAAFVRQFQSGFVPGLLQTAEYAEAVTVDSADAIYVPSVVQFRLRRQSELARRLAPRQIYVVDEAVIRRHVGINRDPAIMPNQLRSIADRAQRDELISVQVIPFKAGANKGMSGPFTLLEFDGKVPDLLYLDTGRESALITGHDSRITEYAEDFEVLLGRALSDEESIQFIREVAQDLS